MLWNAAQPYKTWSGSEPTDTHQSQKLLSEKSKSQSNLYNSRSFMQVSIIYIGICILINYLMVSGFFIQGLTLSHSDRG